MSKLRRNRDPESRRYWAGVDQLAAEVKQWPDWMGGERRTATMSETTLDRIRHWRDRAVQGVVTRLTTAEIIRLCDAAERAETLEAEVAKWNKCDSLVCPYEQRAMQAEAQLIEVTRERDELRQVSETAISGWKARSAKAEAALKMEQNAHDVCSHGQQIIIDKLNQESQRAESAEAALAPLRAVVEAFLAKLEQVKPAIDGAFVMGHVHGARYTGPTIGEEIEAMRRALPADRGQILSKNTDSKVHAP